jgi:hypothetical protein
MEVNHSGLFSSLKIKQKISGYNECTLMILLFKRLILKSSFIFKQVKEKLNDPHGFLQKAFVNEISILLSYNHLFASRFDIALNNCSLNKYTTFGSIYYNLIGKEKVIDDLIGLLRKNKLDENTNLDAFEESCSYFGVICRGGEYVLFKHYFIFRMSIKNILMMKYTIIIS